MSEPRIPGDLLNEIRARVTISDVARRHGVTLRKSGLEWEGVVPWRADKKPSLHVNDRKQRWFDNATSEDGDVFDFERRVTGCSFSEAVEHLAGIAGLPVPNGHGGGKAHSNGKAPLERPARAADGDQRQAGIKQPRKIAAVYDYQDADGGLVYQVVRFEPKGFAQRQPDPDKPGQWLWNLEGIAHGLYRLPELREEMAQDQDDRRIVFLPEGEKDCDTLAQWGLIATTNSGGAKFWAPHHAAEFEGADVVLVLDNDTPGRERADIVGASLQGIARTCRVLDWPAHWPDCPAKGDVTDWRDKAGGTGEKLLALVEHLPIWAPPPFQSLFGAVSWADMMKPREPYKWLVHGVIPANERMVVYGEPQCGKSFWAMTLAISIARGVELIPRARVTQAGVIYCAFEGGKGFPSRVKAYMLDRGLSPDDGTPFACLTRDADMFNREAQNGVEKLIAECRALAATFSIPLGLIVFDTVSACTPGMDENAGEQFGLFLANTRAIAAALNCSVMLVHHVPKNGGDTPRGSGKVTGDLETTISVRFDEHNQVDQDNRPIRVAHLKKQREGEGNLEVMRFVLRKVNIGTDEFGGQIPACVVAAPDGTATDTGEAGGYKLSGGDAFVFGVLMRALAEYGEDAPGMLELPPGTRVVNGGRVKAVYKQLDTVERANDTDERREFRAVQGLKLSGRRLLNLGIIGRKSPYWWWAGRAIKGFPETQSRKRGRATQKAIDEVREGGRDDFEF